MKKLFVLAVALAFVVVGAQAFASPPVKPPAEGFIISTETAIECDGTVKESESFNWTYFEGYKQGNIIAYGAGTSAAAPYYAAPGYGWQEGAQIAYQQDFSAVNGVTSFIKDFAATTQSIPNLTVNKIIGFTANPGNAGLATHTEKVGMSIVSQGGSQGLNFAGLLSLCPWAVEGGNYPATNEGIAAGSSFKVTEIQNFNTTSTVTTTDIPKLKYVVDAPYGVGDISAKFVVELFEAPKKAVLGVVPPLESRTSYSESASASGVWSFKKTMSYESAFPAFGTINPFNSVP